MAYVTRDDWLVLASVPSLERVHRCKVSPGSHLVTDEQAVVYTDGGKIKVLQSSGGAE